MIEIFQDIAAAFQFMTRLPLAWPPYRPDAMARSAKFFPLVGLALGLAIAGIYRALSPHLPMMIVALLVVIFSVLATGALHEDGLADLADGFGGGWTQERILEIMKDSRIGSYGTLAIVLAVAARILLLEHLPSSSFISYVISAEVLSRWTVLPLGRSLPGARKEGSLGASFARQISCASLAVGTLLTLFIVGWLFRTSMSLPIVATLAVTLCSGLYYKRRIGGITGDCFGATQQITLMAVYICGVWQA